MNGWVKIHRKILDKPIWINSSPEQKTILISLLLMVNHQEMDWEWQGVPFRVAPGQTITSLESIAKKCGKGISIQNVRTALKRFEKYGFLTNESTNRNRLITISNWGLYQSNEDEQRSGLTVVQQATNIQLTTNKKGKEFKNAKEVNKGSNRESDIFTEDSVPFQLSLRLLKEIRKNNSQFKEPNLQKWSDVFRLMLERDNRTKEQIVSVIDWCQQDFFWKSNILSPTKLRKHFDQLVLKIHNDGRVKKMNKSSQQFSKNRPSHWHKPKALTNEEISNLKRLEGEMPF